MPNWSLTEITQSAIALIVVSILAFVVASEREMPDAFVNMALLVIGFYFGRATQGGMPKPATALVVALGLFAGWGGSIALAG